MARGPCERQLYYSAYAGQARCFFLYSQPNMFSVDTVILWA